jgi:hypothetical protein
LKAVANEREFEIHPCKLLNLFGEPVKSYAQAIYDDEEKDGVEFVQCAEDDPDLVCWALYERMEDGRLEWQRDCLTKSMAEAELECAESVTAANPDRLVESTSQKAIMTMRGFKR